MRDAQYAQYDINISSGGRGRLVMLTQTYAMLRLIFLHPGFFFFFNFLMNQRALSQLPRSKVRESHTVAIMRCILRNRIDLQLVAIIESSTTRENFVILADRRQLGTILIPLAPSVCLLFEVHSRKVKFASQKSFNFSRFLAHYACTLLPVS